jgi:hypothetical protein
MWSKILSDVEEGESLNFSADSSALTRPNNTLSLGPPYEANKSIIETYGQHKSTYNYFLL